MSSFPLNGITTFPSLHSTFLLLNLLFLASHHLFFKTPLLTFPGSCIFNPLGSNSRKNGFASVTGVLGLSNEEGDPYHTGGHCLLLKPRLRNSFSVVPHAVPRGSIGGLGTFTTLP